MLTSGPILATLVEIVKEKRCDLAGVIDDTQVDQVFGQWKTNGVSEWKIPLLRSVLEGAPWSGKTSVPWTPESVHDYMHAKVVVADDTSFVGSFNLSRSGERNAEDVLEIRDRDVAEPARGVRRRDPRAVPARDPSRDSRRVIDPRCGGATRTKRLRLRNSVPSEPEPLGGWMQQDHRRGRDLQ